MNKTINIGTEINLENLLESRLLIQANSGGGKSVLARLIIEATFGIVPFIVMDIEGEYYTLKEKYGDILVIGGQNGDIPISMQSVRLLPKEIIGNRLSVVIDLSDLKMSDRILYAKHFFEAMMDLPRDYWVSYLVFLEEAHKLAGEQDKQASATAVKDLMSRGRKRGYCGIPITQRISKLHKDVAAECNNKFIGRTFLDIDLDRAAKELGLTSQADKNIIRSLTPGIFYAFGTSITPHHVHTVKVNLPQTKIPKAGVNLDIKPQKPTDKLKAMLAKLNDLPAEAQKELKTIQELQGEVNRLKKEVVKKTPSVTIDNSRLQTELLQVKDQLKATKAELIHNTSALRAIGERMEAAKKLLAIDDANLFKYVQKNGNKVTNNSSFVQKKETKGLKSETKPLNSETRVNTPKSGGALGKCPLAILQFLASFPERSWSKAQVGIATGYSPSSGGFNNSLSELTTKGLICRNDGKLQISDGDISTYLGPDFEPQEYSIDTFKSKLGKCEREIYEVLLSRPHDIFNKETLANETESNYSPGSGGFNNALSTLNTLELISRDRGTIKLNPELLELL